MLITTNKGCRVDLAAVSSRLIYATQICHICDYFNNDEFYRFGSINPQLSQSQTSGHE